jgi:hypothetical protein
VASLSYQGVHLALLAALPELQPCFDRLISDWGTSEGQPLGQYPTFEDTYSVWVKALVGLAAKDEGARALLQRAIDFAEQMLSSDDGEVVGLGIDSCAEWLDIMLGGRELAREMGGPALRRWMSTYSRDDWERTDQEIIDLWGVREVIAGLLPQVPLPEIPGITQPADHHRLGSLAEARANADGAVVLCAYGKSGLFVLARASAVNCDDGHLAQMALELAPVHRPGDRTVMDRGGPTTLYFEVPSGERVWNMTVGADEHGRLTPEIDLWVAPKLEHLRHRVNRRLADPDPPTC